MTRRFSLLPNDNTDPSNTQGSGSNVDVTQLQKDLDAARTALKQFEGIDPAAYKDLVTFKQTADQAAKDAEAKKLEEKGEWEKIANQRIQEISDKLTGELDLTRAEVKALKEEKEKLESSKGETLGAYESLQKQVQLQKALSGMDFVGDFEYFLYKFGNQFQIKDGVLSTTGKESVEETLNAIKKDPSNVAFWKGVTIKGANTPPGTVETKDTSTKGDDGVITVPRAAQRNPQLYVEAGVDPKKAMEMVATGKLKYV